MRRVLESLFRYFDFNEVWSTEKGLALYVLQDVQLLIERSGLYCLHLVYWFSGQLVSNNLLIV